MNNSDGSRTTSDLSQTALTETSAETSDAVFAQPSAQLIIQPSSVPKKLQLPLSRETVRTLKAGDLVLLSGTLYTGRDAAHARMIQAIDCNEKLPFDVENQTIYYVGPAPASPGHAIGSAGPTSSYRMDKFAPRLIELGLTAMIGKGKRSSDVVQAMKEFGAVYFGAVGGAAALIARSIVKAEVIAYPDLGTEAVHRLEAVDFPVTVIIDSFGNNLYESEPPKYRLDF